METQYYTNCAVQGCSSGPREIRKYKNRKYYDTAQSTYVTFDDMVAMVRDGVSIKVVDWAARDITLESLIRFQAKVLERATESHLNTTQRDTVLNATRYEGGLLAYAQALEVQLNAVKKGN